MRPRAARVEGAKARRQRIEITTSAKRCRFIIQSYYSYLLFITESFDGTEAGGAGGGVESGDEADDDGEGDGSEGEPERDSGDIDSREILTREINVSAESESAADEPSESDAADASEKTHHASFSEEKLLDVAVVGAESFENADFAAAFENGHDERVDDAQSGDGEGEAAEDSEQEIDDGEEEAQILRGVEKRKCGETHAFDGVFGGLHVGGAFDAHSEALIGARGAGTVDELAKVADVGGAELLGELKRNENVATAESAEAAFRFCVDYADDAKLLFVRDDREAGTDGVVLRG